MGKSILESLLNLPHINLKVDDFLNYLTFDFGGLVTLVYIKISLDALLTSQKILKNSMPQ